MSNFEILQQEVFKKSVSSDWDKAKKEWEVIESYVIEHDEDNEAMPETCSCSKFPIYEVFVLENRINANRMIVGNVCIKHFEEDENLSHLFKDYKKLKQDITVHLSQESLDYMHRNFPTKFTNYKFYTKRRRKRDTSLNSIEMDIIVKSNKLFLDLLKKKNYINTQGVHNELSLFRY